MRIFFTVLFLIFSLQSLTKADDIRDFEIEGISLGVSLLDFFDKKKILSSKVDWYDDLEKNRFLSFAFDEKNFEEYDYVDIWTKYNDKSFKIEGVAGSVYFGKQKQFKDINDCYKKQIEIVDQISGLFTNIKKDGPVKKKHSSDKTGNSTYTDYYFLFENNNNITVSCYDWSDKMGKETGRYDHFAIFIRTVELDSWLK